MEAMTMVLNSQLVLHMGGVGTLRVCEAMDPCDSILLAI